MRETMKTAAILPRLEVGIAHLEATNQAARFYRVVVP
jgi:hypothetical protein